MNDLPNKKAILLALDGFGQGGIQQAYKVLVDEYCKSFEEVYLLVMQSSNFELNLDRSQKITVLRAEGNDLFDWKAFVRFRRFLKNKSPNVIIASMYRSQIWSAIAKQRNTKLIWVEHNTYVGRTKLQWLVMKLLIKKVDKVVGVSYEVSEFSRKKLKRKTVTIPNPITIPTVNSTKNIRPDDFVFIGRLTEQKNPELMLRSFHQFLVTFNIKSILHIVGGGPLLGEMIELSKKLGIENSCVFHGWLTLNQISEILPQTKTLVSTSTIEGMGIVRLEALASGSCVVTTNTGGTELFSELSEFGFFVTSGESQDIASFMNKSLGNQYWEEKSLKQRIRFTTRFNAAKIASELID